MSFTDLSTLLTTVDAATARHLELLASACRRGETASSRLSIANIPQEQITIPVVAITIADIYEHDGHESQRAEVLGNAIEAYPIEGYQTISNEDVLLKILNAGPRLRAFGTMKDSLATCRMARRRLSAIALNEVTDVEIRCLLEYHRFIEFCDKESNLILDSDRGLVASGNRAQSELEFLLGVLLERESFEDALQIAIVLDDAPGIYKSSETLMENSSAVSLTRALEGLLHLLQLSQTQQQLSGVLLRVEHVRSKLEAAGLLTPAADLTVRKIKFREAPPEGAMDTALGYIALADEARSSGWLPTARQCVLDALDVLREELRMHDGGVSPASQLHCSLLHEQINMETENLGPNALYVQKILCLAGSPLVTGGQARTLVSHLEEFWSRYSGFDLPNGRYQLTSLGESAARALQDVDLRNIYRTAMVECRGETCVASRRIDGIFVLTDAGSAAVDWYRSEIVDADPDRMRLNIVWVLLKWAIIEFKSRPIDVDTISTFALFAPIRGGLWELLQRARDTVDWIPLLAPAAEVTTINIFGSSSITASDHEFVPRLLGIEAWLLDPRRTSFVVARHYALKTLWEMRRYAIRRQSGTLDFIDAKVERTQLVVANNQLLRIFSLLCEDAKGHDPLQQIRTIVGENAFLASFNEDSADLSNLIVEEFDVAIRIGIQNADLYRKQSRTRLEYGARTVLSRLMKQKCLQFLASDSGPLFAQLELNDDIYSVLRRGLSPLGHRTRRDSIMLETKIRNVELLDHYRTYDLAIDTALAEVRKLIDATQDDIAHVSTLVSWVERFKSRSFLDELGFWASVPEHILSKATVSSEASEALIEEQELRNRIAIAELRRQSEQLPRIQGDLERVLDRQKRITSLNEITYMRDGCIASLPELEAFSESVGENVLLAEYFICPYDKSIMILLLKAGSKPRLEEVKSIKYPDIQRWIEDNIAKPEPLSTETSSNRLRQLAALVEPLIRHSAPNDTLVICPTRSLHRIPFAALPTSSDDDGGSGPLIARNQVVSCTSLSLLRFLARNSAEAPGGGGGGSFRSVLIHASDSPDHFGFYHDLARRLNAHALIGEHISPRAVAAALSSPNPDQRVSLVHFPGRVSFDKGEPTESCLELGAQPRKARAGVSTRGRLTAADIFRLTLARGALAVIVGCESGRTAGGRDDADGDPLGLVTAFHFAGASAVVSSLWAIEDADGRRFAERFHGRLLREARARGERPGGGMVDLAKVMRRTILDLMSGAGGGSVAPYRWAAFTLNGYWMLPVGDLGDFPGLGSVDRAGGVSGGFTGLLNSCRLM